MPLARRVRKRADSTSSIQSFVDSASVQKMNSSLEERLLHKMDSFLADMESKLDHLEEYLMEPSASSSSKDKLLPSPQLLATWKKVKLGMAKNHEKSLHPLVELLEENEDPVDPVDPVDEESVDSVEDPVEDLSLQRQTSHSSIFSNISVTSEINYTKIMDRLRSLDAKLDDFEGKYNVLLKNPQETLKQLKSSLYNYEKALAAGSYRLLHFYELPFQWRENKFIIFGYRFSESHASAVKSILHWHNETCNIWSHLLGAALIIYLALFHYPSTRVYKLTTMSDHIVTFMFFVAAIKCMLFSVIWHTYASISTLHLRQRFACFDYTGITVLIIASVITTEHIGLKDYTFLRLGYVIFSFLTGSAGVVFTWSPKFDKPESRIIRIAFFVSLAALGVTSFFTSSFKRSFAYSFDLYSPLFFSFMWYIIGVVFYGCLIPERWRSDVVIDEFNISDETVMKLDREGKLQEYLDKIPQKTKQYGKFLSLWWVDYVLNSHNIWHVFVLLGILGHYYATLKMFEKIL
ncbi:hypothetical protein FOA43_002926 [Brettanomyces nanus]|uniref:ADIPOR-like receptor IZH3 n=1 Tax=Eeniella nana TaxID=13502 RepID=A0A875RPX2_EENNA|nr:uncharacterized protein FOA43_002926 [Brettanomyces nanus]QPG75570.1 hypothetical protein FOA43_002926 [Brettanomyces nanus]